MGGGLTKIGLFRGYFYFSRLLKEIRGVSESWKVLNRGGKLERQFRGCFPGLYSRLMKRYKRLDERETAREELVRKRQLMVQMQDTSQQLGPGSPMWGRRPKRHLATVQIEDKVESESEESEPDLGPLRALDQIHQMDETFQSFESFATPVENQAGNKEEDAELTDEGVELILDASRHVARGIVERTRGARAVLLDEMSESMDVLNNLSTVLEVLGKRTRDLEAQQRQVLKRH